MMVRRGLITRLYRASAAIVVLANLFAFSSTARAETLINWRVENPFRFFSDPADTDVHRATFAALDTEEKTSPILSAEHALGAREKDGWAARMYRKSCWNWAANRFTCSEGGDYINPTSHTVVAEPTGIEEGEIECTWLTAPKGGKQGRGEALKQPCSEPAKFDIPYPDGATLSLEVGGVEVARTEVKVIDLFIVGMGDSFASGEGNPDVPVRLSAERAANYSKGKDKDALALAGYPARVGPWKKIGDKEFLAENARWLDQACHRSLYSHQLRTALQLAIEDPHRAVTFAGVACSGAEITWGLFLRYKGNEWVPNPPDLSQISQIAEAQCGNTDAPLQDLPEAYHMQGQVKDLVGGLVLKKCQPEKARKIDLLFLSIGGNDIGFSRLLANAVISNESSLRELGGWFGQVHGQSEAAPLIETLDYRYKALNRAFRYILHMPFEESDRIILTAYPGLALLGDGSKTCPDGKAGMDVLSDFEMSEAKVREGVWVADKLERGMRGAAKAYGWSFAESHRQGFIGRGLCAGFTDNAFSVADDLRLPRKIDGKWVPYNPSEFRAYAPRQRWFRTPNDAFLTGNFHVAGSLMQKVLKLESFSWFQVLLASTYSGAFHPTAEGHAAIADSVAAEARTILEKYGQSSDLAARN